MKVTGLKQEPYIKIQTDINLKEMVIIKIRNMKKILMWGKDAVETAKQ